MERVRPRNKEEKCLREQKRERNVEAATNNRIKGNGVRGKG